MDSVLRYLRVASGGLTAVQQFTSFLPFLPGWVGPALFLASTVVKDCLQLLPAVGGNTTTKPEA